MLAEYNTAKHRITGLSPTDARRPSSEADAKAGMELAATSGVNFPTKGGRHRANVEEIRNEGISRCI